jgi:hypothetical protein
MIPSSFEEGIQGRSEKSLPSFHRSCSRIEKLVLRRSTGKTNTNLKASDILTWFTTNLPFYPLLVQGGD